MATAGMSGTSLPCLRHCGAAPFAFDFVVDNIVLCIPCVLVHVQPRPEGPRDERERRKRNSHQSRKRKDWLEDLSTSYVATCRICIIYTFLLIRCTAVYDRTVVYCLTCTRTRDNVLCFHSSWASSSVWPSLLLYSTGGFSVFAMYALAFFGKMTLPL